MVSYYSKKLSFAVEGYRRSSLKDFDSHEAHWWVKLPIEQRIGLKLCFYYRILLLALHIVLICSTTLL